VKVRRTVDGDVITDNRRGRRWWRGTGGCLAEGGGRMDVHDEDLDNPLDWSASAAAQRFYTERTCAQCAWSARSPRPQMKLAAWRA
jgi:hypothetical protein